MGLSYLFSWLMVAYIVLATPIQLKFVLTHQYNRGALITWTAQSVLALASLVGLVLAQLHQVHLFDTNLYFLFFAAYMLSMILDQWTHALSARQPISRKQRLLLVFFVVYALFALALVIFHAWT